MSLGAYLNAGGVDISNPTNQSGGLWERMMDLATPGTIERLKLGENVAKSYLIPESLCTVEDTYQIERYLKGVKVGMSARRHHQFAKRLGASGLMNPDTLDYQNGGGAYAHTAHRFDFSDPVPITRANMLDFIARKRLDDEPPIGSYNNPGYPPYADIIARAVDRYFPED